MPVLKVHIFAAHPVILNQCEHALRRLKCSGTRQVDCSEVSLFDRQLDSLQTQLLITRVRSPETRLLVLVFGHDENDCLRWISQGVHGIVSYERLKSDLPRALRKVAAGSLWLPPSVLCRWKEKEAAAQPSARTLGLTPREHEIAECLLRRMSNKEIATFLHVSERTAKFHVGNILTKLRLTSRYELLGGLCAGSNVSSLGLGEIFCRV